MFNLFAPLKNKFTPSPKRKRDIKKINNKDLLLISEIVCPKILVRFRKTTVWKEFAFVAPDGTDSKKTKKMGLFLERVGSNVFENLITVIS